MFRARPIEGRTTIGGCLVTTCGGEAAGVSPPDDQSRTGATGDGLAAAAAMITHRDLEKLFKVPARRRVSLDDFDPGWAGRDFFRHLKKDRLKARAEGYLRTNLTALSAAQQLLWANDRHAVLIVLQAMDAAGKDGTIRHVMSGINPQGCQVFNFRKPSDEELDHTFLWRFMKALPERGRIGIFNRSYYEDVLVVRVHPEILARQKLPNGSRDRRFWKQRYDDINEFERHLVRNGTIVLKFFLHISKDEQRRRFLSRLTDPAKHWKVSTADLDEREHWDAYQEAFEEAFRRTSTTWAPWWVIPADHKWVARALVAAIVTRAIQNLKLKMPTVTAERRRELAAARRRLSA
jgi:PPK2 family polyphosphate:nucleotide phosphotransferase